MLINKKEYNNFISKYHETYFNLEIYPVLNELQKEELQKAKINLENE